MVQYKLKCECGFESNYVPYGDDVWSDEYCIPVFVPGDENLKTIRLVQKTNETDEKFEDRIHATVTTKLELEFTPNSIALMPVLIESKEPLPCPRCGCKSAVFTFAGF